jgi:hypothetical protein
LQDKYGCEAKIAIAATPIPRLKPPRRPRTAEKGRESAKRERLAVQACHPALPEFAEPRLGMG